jgi:hypothetical protein
MSGTEGFGSQQLPRNLNMDPSDKLVDKYGLENDTNSLKEKLFANNDEDDVDPKSDFLKIAKGQGDLQAYKEEEPLTADKVKFKAEDGSEQPVNSSAPKIQEMSSTTFVESKSSQSA